ncbi:MAG: HD domain-containing protein [Acidobacteria bacterium]|nr:HD domain-containing protein [Acidobacteriota bacterium]
MQTLSVRTARVLVSDTGPAGERARREVEMHSLGLAAALHDIGKLFVPWSLLNKLIPLNEGERSILRKHSENGRYILEQVGLPEIGAIVVEHHEAPDGSGYPTGRRDSSLMGATIAVADAFEAMTTVNRHYRRAKSRAEAVAEIKGLAHAQFDGDAARALEVALSRA